VAPQESKQKAVDSKLDGEMIDFRIFEHQVMLKMGELKLLFEKLCFNVEERSP
jgi:hypothetical protein